MYKMTDVLNSSQQRLFKVISFFSGAGGSSLGYRLAGGTVLCANEFVKEARDTYSANFKDTLLLENDIRELKGSDILAKLHLEVGEIDIVDGSPPCCAFSTNANGAKKNWGKEKKYSTLKHKVRLDDLFFEYSRMIKELQPKVFVAENTASITYQSNVEKFGTNQACLFDEQRDTVLDSLSACGYKIYHQVLNANNYDVPQSRRRLFIVGIRKDIQKPFKFPEKTSSPTIEEAFKNLTNDASECLALEEDLKKKKTMYAIVQQMPKNPDKYINGPSILKRLSYHNLIRVPYNKPAQTLTQLDAVFSGQIHPEYDRKFTIPEKKRIMSFPDDFILTGNYALQSERLGRAVPPLLMKALATAIYEQVLKC